MHPQKGELVNLFDTTKSGGGGRNGAEPFVCRQEGGLDRGGQTAESSIFAIKGERGRLNPAARESSQGGKDRAVHRFSKGKGEGTRKQGNRTNRLAPARGKRKRKLLQFQHTKRGRGRKHLPWSESLRRIERTE